MPVGWLKDTETLRRPGQAQGRDKDEKKDLGSSLHSLPSKWADRLSLRILDSVTSGLVQAPSLSAKSKEGLVYLLLFLPKAKEKQLEEVGLGYVSSLTHKERGNKTLGRYGETPSPVTEEGS